MEGTILDSGEIREIRKLAVQFALEISKINGDNRTASVTDIVKDAGIIERYIVNARGIDG